MTLAFVNLQHGVSLPVAGPFIIVLDEIKVNAGNFRTIRPIKTYPGTQFDIDTLRNDYIYSNKSPEYNKRWSQYNNTPIFNVRAITRMHKDSEYITCMNKYTRLCDAQLGQLQTWLSPAAQHVCKTLCLTTSPIENIYLSYSLVVIFNFNQFKYMSHILKSYIMNVRTYSYATPYELSICNESLTHITSWNDNHLFNGNSDYSKMSSIITDIYMLYPRRSGLYLYVLLSNPDQVYVQCRAKIGHYETINTERTYSTTTHAEIFTCYYDIDYMVQILESD